MVLYESLLMTGFCSNPLYIQIRNYNLRGNLQLAV